MSQLADDTEQPGLEWLAALATPLWLVRADGRVVWLNDAARGLLDRLGVADGARIGPEEAVRRALSDPIELRVTIREEGGGSAAELAVRAGPAPGADRRPGGPLLLLEATSATAAAAAADTARARREAERLAEEAHRLLLDAIDCIGEGFVLYDADDRLVLYNRRYRDLMVGDLERAGPGTPFEAVLREGVRSGLYRLAPGQADAWTAQRLDLHRNGGPPMEVQLQDGRWLRIEERRTRDGGTVGLRTDITDLKTQALELAAARDGAEAANLRKSDFVHHLSHELRTPLTAVIGFAEILRDQLMGPPGNPRYREAAAQIVTAGDYMLELINNLLDLARIEAGRLDLHEDECPLGLIADATTAMMAARAEQAGVTLAVRVPDDLPVLRGDPSLVRQMLTNLIGNAVKFTPSGGHVTITAAPDGEGGLIVTVTDDGRGMAPEHIPTALTAFSQVHDRMTVPQHGTGLGLPLTAALVALHGGTIAIDSAPGHGTRVRLRFPPERIVAAEPA